MCNLRPNICLIPLPGIGLEGEKVFHVRWEFEQVCRSRVTFEDYKKLPENKRSETKEGMGLNARYCKINLEILNEDGDPRKPEVAYCEIRKNRSLFQFPWKYGQWKESKPPKPPKSTSSSKTPTAPPRQHWIPMTDCNFCPMVLAATEEERRAFLSEQKYHTMTLGEFMSDNSIELGERKRIKDAMDAAHEFLPKMKKIGRRLLDDKYPKGFRGWFNKFTTV